MSGSTVTRVRFIRGGALKYISTDVDGVGHEQSAEDFIAGLGLGGGIIDNAVSANRVQMTGSVGTNPAGDAGVQRFGSYVQIWSSAAWMGYQNPNGVVLGQSNGYNFAANDLTSATTAPSIDTRIKRAAAGTVGVYQANGTTPGTIQAASIANGATVFNLGSQGVTFSSNILPAGNTRDIGSQGAPWRDVYAAAVSSNRVQMTGSVSTNPAGNAGVQRFGSYVQIWSNGAWLGYQNSNGAVLGQSNGYNFASNDLTSATTGPSIDTRIKRAATGTVGVYQANGTTPGTIHAASFANGDTAQTTLGNATGGNQLLGPFGSFGVTPVSRPQISASTGTLSDLFTALDLLGLIELVA